MSRRALVAPQLGEAAAARGSRWIRKGRGEAGAENWRQEEEEEVTRGEDKRDQPLEMRRGRGVRRGHEDARGAASEQPPAAVAHVQPVLERLAASAGSLPSRLRAALSLQHQVGARSPSHPTPSSPHPLRCLHSSARKLLHGADPPAEGHALPDPARHRHPPPPRRCRLLLRSAPTYFSFV